MVPRPGNPIAFSQPLELDLSGFPTNRDSAHGSTITLIAVQAGDMRKLLRDSGLGSTAFILVGSLALLSLTFICYRLRLNLATAVLLFLIVVVLLSLAGDFVSSIVASVVAALCLAHLAPPIGFRIADTLDVVAVAAFFITSLAIIILLHKMRKVADDALKRVRRQLVETEERQRRRIAGDLYDDVCQQLTLMAVQLQEKNHSDLGVLREELLAPIRSCLRKMVVNKF